LGQSRIFTRDGGRWGIGQVHRILTRATYIGRHEFNKRSKTKELKPVSEVIDVAVPPLIEQATFDAVQAQLRSRNPKVTPARVVSGPTLLTGICFCADCGGAMTLRTGKGGRYRYYTCSIKARQGETGCKGRSIPMDKLDNLVAGHIEERLLQPERLEKVQASVLDRRQERTERRREHIAAQRVEVADSEVRIMGSKGDLLRTLAAASGVKSATPGVRSSVLNWRSDKPRYLTFSKCYLESPGILAISLALRRMRSLTLMTARRRPMCQ
jgi:site-specific DNA recombinase